jgi:hypothetical protein
MEVVHHGEAMGGGKIDAGLANGGGSDGLDGNVHRRISS